MVVPQTPGSQRKRYIPRKLDLPKTLEIVRRHIEEYGWNVSVIAELAGVTHHTIRNRMRCDPNFFNMVVTAREAFLHKLEKAAIDRATKGWQEERRGPDGELLGSTLRMSDALLVKLLKKNDPAGYGETLRVEKTTTHELGLAKLSAESQKLLLKVLDTEKMKARLAEAKDAEFQVCPKPEPVQKELPEPADERLPEPADETDRDSEEDASEDHRGLVDDAFWDGLNDKDP